MPKGHEIRPARKGYSEGRLAWWDERLWGVGITVIVEREDGREVRGFPDPAGGTFDASGDFDRVLSEGEESFAVLKLIDPDGDTVITAADLDGLLADIDRAAALALNPVERRGLERLRVMAQHCRDDPTLHLRFIGD